MTQGRPNSEKKQENQGVTVPSAAREALLEALWRAFWRADDENQEKNKVLMQLWRELAADAKALLNSDSPESEAKNTQQLVGRAEAFLDTPAVKAQHFNGTQTRPLFKQVGELYRAALRVDLLNAADSISTVDAKAMQVASKPTQAARAAIETAKQQLAAVTAANAADLSKAEYAKGRLDAQTDAFVTGLRDAKKDYEAALSNFGFAQLEEDCNNRTLNKTDSSEIEKMRERLTKIKTSLSEMKLVEAKSFVPEFPDVKTPDVQGSLIEAEKQLKDANVLRAPFARKQAELAERQKRLRHMANILPGVSQEAANNDIDKQPVQFKPVWSDLKDKVNELFAAMAKQEKTLADAKKETEQLQEDQVLAADLAAVTQQFVALARFDAAQEAKEQDDKFEQLQKKLDASQANRRAALDLSTMTEMGATVTKLKNEYSNLQTSLEASLDFLTKAEAQIAARPEVKKGKRYERFADLIPRAAAGFVLFTGGFITLIAGGAFAPALWGAVGLAAVAATPVGWALLCVALSAVVGVAMMGAAMQVWRKMDLRGQREHMLDTYHAQPELQQALRAQNESFKADSTLKKVMPRLTRMQMIATGVVASDHVVALPEVKSEARPDDAAEKVWKKCRVNGESVPLYFNTKSAALFFDNGRELAAANMDNAIAFNQQAYHFRQHSLVR